MFKSGKPKNNKPSYNVMSDTVQLTTRSASKFAKGPWNGPFSDFSSDMSNLNHLVYGDNNGHIFSDLSGSPVASMTLDRMSFGALVAAAPPAGKQHHRHDDDGARHKAARNHTSEVDFAHNKGVARGHNGGMAHASSKRGQARRRAAGCMHGLQQPTRGVN